MTCEQPKQGRTLLDRAPSLLVGFIIWAKVLHIPSNFSFALSEGGVTAQFGLHYAPPVVVSLASSAATGPAASSRRVCCVAALFVAGQSQSPFEPIFACPPRRALVYCTGPAVHRPRLHANPMHHVAFHQIPHASSTSPRSGSRACSLYGLMARLRLV